ncbi:MAG: hypothetical protein CMN30_02440 [Sandaracinus sp.]|nr:hypothetical protein [Sandaracinus sp.]|tara:strand:+ start:415 stop:822 length:408 start_codon:yes stop_codon:yes gene_type:complete
MSDDDLRTKARRRALRAARVVTLGLAMAAPACGESYEVGGDDDSPDDGGVILVDAHPPGDAGPGDLGQDARPPDPRDAGPMDADVAVDMGCPTDPFGTPPETEECCEAVGGWWDEATGQCAVAVPGPFVPPAMSA